MIVGLKVFVFNSVKYVKEFEELMKQGVLIEYIIGNSKKGIEQYYCPEFNTCEFVVSKAIKLFNLLNYKGRNLGHIMESHLVDDYNKRRAKSWPS